MLFLYAVGKTRQKKATCNEVSTGVAWIQKEAVPFRVSTSCQQNNDENIFKWPSELCHGSSEVTILWLLRV
jgi:hypothetical protein